MNSSVARYEAPSPLAHPGYDMVRELRKGCIEDLAIFGGTPIFSAPKPTSNLVRPDPERFYSYLSDQSWPSDTSLIEELEHRLAVMHGVAHCVVSNSGFWGFAMLTDALLLPNRREVVMPSLTYRRMADIIAWVGRTPHFCDIDPATLANSASTVEACITAETALMIGVHPVGGHCDIDGLTELSRDRGIPLLFDSVEAVHQRHGSRRIGAFGDAEIFSLGASKLVNGFEGGYVTTDNPRLADTLRRKREGKGPGLSLTAPLPRIHAAMALAGLDDLPDQLRRNALRFECYRQALADLPELRLIEQDPATEPSYKNIVIEVMDDWPLTRDQTIRALNGERILARPYYAPPLTHKPISYSHIAGHLPYTDWAAGRFISLPCGHLVGTEDIALMIAFLRHLRNHAPAILLGLASLQSVGR